MMFVNSLAKAAPKIFGCAAILLTGASLVTTVRATKKSMPEFEEMKEDLDAIKTVREAKSEEEYPKKMYRKELTHIYISHGKKIAKNFVLPVSLFSAGVGCGVSGFAIQGKRLAKATQKAATMTAVATGFKKAYDTVCHNIEEDLGKDALEKYKFGIEEREVQDVEVDDKGKEKKVKKKVKFAKNLSPFAVTFDSFCPNHSKDPGLNFQYVRDMDAYFKEQAKIRDNHRVWCCEITTALGCKLDEDQEKLMQVHFFQYDPETGEGLPELILSDDIYRSFVTGETDEDFEREYQEHIMRLDIPDTQDARNYFKHNYYEPELIIDMEPNGNWKNL